MFEFWYEKIIARLIPILVFLSIFGIFIYAFYTEISVPPADEAPFVQDMRSEAAKKGSKTVVTFEKAHMADSELKAWISKTVSESLSFNKANFSDNAKSISDYYTQDGFQKYQAYLLSSGIAENIRANDFDMSVYIEDPPLLLNSSVINNQYKWLYQLPVAVSFFPTGQKNFAKDADKFINRKLTLRLQITRANLNDNPYAIQIEDWNVVAR